MQRAEILDVLVAGAAELSASSSLPPSLQSLSLSSSSNLLSGAKDILQTRVEKNTRRWSDTSRLLKRRISQTNRFSPLAGLFFFPLLRSYDQKRFSFLPLFLSSLSFFLSFSDPRSRFNADFPLISWERIAFFWPNFCFPCRCLSNVQEQVSIDPSSLFLFLFHLLTSCFKPTDRSELQQRMVQSLLEMTPTLWSHREAIVRQASIFACESPSLDPS